MKVVQILNVEEATLDVYEDVTGHLVFFATVVTPNEWLNNHVSFFSGVTFFIGSADRSNYSTFYHRRSGCMESTNQDCTRFKFTIFKLTRDTIMLAEDDSLVVDLTGYLMRSGSEHINPVCETGRCYSLKPIEPL
jgi:hypothetical protein